MFVLQNVMKTFWKYYSYDKSFIETIETWSIHDIDIHFSEQITCQPVKIVSYADTQKEEKLSVYPAPVAKDFWTLSSTIFST